MTRRALIMAGGTGGHIFPGIAVADELKSQGWDICWLGTADRMEAQLVPKAGYPIEFIDVAGVRGNGLNRLLAAPFRIIKSIVQSFRVMRKIQPHIVIGMGGFASGPGGVAAKLLSIPLVVHEQNAAAGLTNRLLAKLATRVLLGFEGAFSGELSNPSKFIFTGNPVRTEFSQARQLPRDDTSVVNILVVGGSLGAQTLNQNLPKAFGQLTEAKFNIRHQCGSNNQEEVQNAYDVHQVKNVTVSPFIDDMASAMAWADLVVCRAGALTVAEVAAIGVAALFVPLPHAVDDHQTKNAMVITTNGGGLLVSQKQLEAGELTGIIQPLIGNPDILREMAKRCTEMAKHDALSSVVTECISVAKEK